MRLNTDYYLANAAIIKDAFIKIGFETYGGDNSPYVWVKSPEHKSSWELFSTFLNEFGFSTTPGSGFGDKGEGFIRLTGFNSRENTEKAMKRLVSGYKK